MIDVLRTMNRHWGNERIFFFKTTYDWTTILTQIFIVFLCFLCFIIYIAYLGCAFCTF
jgi:hypothetical protein